LRVASGAGGAFPDRKSSEADDGNLVAIAQRLLMLSSTASVARVASALDKSASLATASINSDLFIFWSSKIRFLVNSKINQECNEYQSPEYQRDTRARIKA
jgi:hypothetical protein